MIEAKTLTEWITVMDNPKILESLEETGMKVMAKVNDSINEDAIQQDKLLKQDSITEFYPNSINKYKGHIPTIDEMLARMHNKVNIGRKAIPLDQELLPLQLSNESSIEIPLTSINSTNSIFEQNSPVEDDLLNLSGLPNAEYFEAEEGSLESFESIVNKTKNMDDASRLFKEESYEVEPNVVVNNSVENLETKDTSTTTTKKISVTTAMPLTTQTITETNFFSTKLFKSIFNGFDADNKIIQSEEIDINSFNTVKPHDHQNNLITDSESNLNRAMSDCNNKAPLGSEEFQRISVKLRMA
uniref:Uncharacterized protein n=1 Tax=Acrobeloides nanus TaxID=290746 RepID=A0A914CJD0_9BILA